MKKIILLIFLTFLFSCGTKKIKEINIENLTFDEWNKKNYFRNPKLLTTHTSDDLFPSVYENKLLFTTKRSIKNEIPNFNIVMKNLITKEIEVVKKNTSNEEYAKIGKDKIVYVSTENNAFGSIYLIEKNYFGNNTETLIENYAIQPNFSYDYENICYVNIILLQ